MMSTPHPFYENPPYVWPNPEIFPFRVFLDRPDLRIFLIDCIPHNWAWFRKYHRNFQERDVFIVFSATSGLKVARNTEETFKALDLNKEQFIMLGNDPDEVAAFSKIGLSTVLVNNNAFLDDRIHMNVMPDAQKLYDAIYVGRRIPLKRQMLAKKVERLAIIAGNNHGPNIEPVPDDLAYLNDQVLNEKEVMEKINQSRCGLVLSEWEGACYASSEYLLCGVPVVSSPSIGGRDQWYNEYNSIICEPNEDAVKEAVEYFVANPRDPQAIRQAHVDQARVYRKTFMDMLQGIFDRYGVGLSGEAYFEEHFYHKMKKSYRMDLEALFGPAK